MENFIASHLFKAVHFWTDRGLGEYQLYFLRDKEKREVDFLVVKNKQPWLLVEVKSSDNAGLSKSLFYSSPSRKPRMPFKWSSTWNISREIVFPQKHPSLSLPKPFCPSSFKKPIPCWKTKKRVNFFFYPQERWLSGRKHVPAKDAYPLNGYRGFESLSFRFFKIF